MSSVCKSTKARWYICQCFQLRRTCVWESTSTIEQPCISFNRFLDSWKPFTFGSKIRRCSVRTHSYASENQNWIWTNVHDWHSNPKAAHVECNWKPRKSAMAIDLLQKFQQRVETCVCGLSSTNEPPALPPFACWLPGCLDSKMSQLPSSPLQYGISQ